MPEPELLPCPFCWGEPDVTQARLGRVLACKSPDCPICGWSMTEAQWQSRTPPPATRDTSKLDDQDRRLKLLERAIVAEKRAKELEAGRTPPPATAELLRQCERRVNEGWLEIADLIMQAVAEWSDPAAPGLDGDRAPSPGTHGDATTCGDSSAG